VHELLNPFVDLPVGRGAGQQLPEEGDLAIGIRLSPATQGSEAQDRRQWPSVKDSIVRSEPWSRAESIAPAVFFVRFDLAN
jgi:hypothetical protein